ncbi:ubiquitinyl hydrolase 1 [Ranunculus cassubicifolius]
MLGLLNTRPKPWIVTELSFTHNGAHHRFTPSTNQVSLLGVLRGGETCRQNHSTTCRIRNKCGGGASSVWHAIFPCARECHNHNLVPQFYQDNKGEGSWNVAWDVRPARWLHGSDSAWLLFGVCACLSAAAPAPVCDENIDVNLKKEEDVVVVRAALEEIYDSTDNENSQKYRVIGVPGDGRCLFRAVTYGACLKCAEELPNENGQRELADNLRARVVDELLKRRKETEWMIEGDFDMYVESIQRPNAWGGEPELLMASHVLRVPISVFMIDRRSKELLNIANYGHDEYGKEELPIQVLFHGYGHYDVLEIFPDNTTSQKKKL